MKINREQAKHLDLILELLVDKTVNVNSVEEIKENLLKDKSYEYCLSLFYILSDHHPRLLYPISGLSEDTFWASEYVPAFLHDGGFSAIYDSAAAKLEIEEEKERLNIEKLRYDVKNSKRIYKTYWWTFAISIVGFLLALSKIILDLVNKK